MCTMYCVCVWKICMHTYFNYFVGFLPFEKHCAGQYVFIDQQLASDKSVNVIIVQCLLE